MTVQLVDLDAALRGDRLEGLPIGFEIFLPPIGMPLQPDFLEFAVRLVLKARGLWRDVVEVFQ